MKCPHIKQLTTVSSGSRPTPLQPTRHSPTISNFSGRIRGRVVAPHPRVCHDVTNPRQPDSVSKTYCSLRCRSGLPSVPLLQRLLSLAVPRGSAGWLAPHSPSLVKCADERRPGQSPSKLHSSKCCHGTMWGALGALPWLPDLPVPAPATTPRWARPDGPRPPRSSCHTSTRRGALPHSLPCWWAPALPDWGHLMARSHTQLAMAAPKALTGPPPALPPARAGRRGTGRGARPCLTLPPWPPRGAPARGTVYSFSVHLEMTLIKKTDLD